MKTNYYETSGVNLAPQNRNKDFELVNEYNTVMQQTARTWQIVAVSSLLSFFIALGVIIYAFTLPQTVPVIVTVSPDGEASYIGKVDKSSYGNTAVPEIAKEYQIRKLISCMFSWFIDRNAQNHNIEQAFEITESAAKRELDLFYRTNNPFEYFGERTRAVSFDPVLKQTEKTYIVNFTVTERFISGYEGRTVKYTALVNIDHYQATQNNPLGLYVTNFDIKQMEAK